MSLEIFVDLKDMFLTKHTYTNLIQEHGKLLQSIETGFVQNQELKVNHNAWQSYKSKQALKGLIREYNEF
jgi:hypothetical protein